MDPKYFDATSRFDCDQILVSHRYYKERTYKRQNIPS